MEWAREHRTVKGFPGGDPFRAEEVITWPVDVLIPAALENAITAENAREVRASLIVEGANGPTTPEADQILRERNVTIVPDILANAGGVTVSYFEWAQNIQGFPWEEERIIRELEKTMERAYADVVAAAKQKSVCLRAAAFFVGIRRVAQAATSRRALRSEIPLS
jgi:glutamate dehydrogenase/leucine dehydrogenase